MLRAEAEDLRAELDAHRQWGQRSRWALGRKHE
jgi:hypothetical protein